MRQAPGPVAGGARAAQRRNAPAFSSLSRANWCKRCQIRQRTLRRNPKGSASASSSSSSSSTGRDVKVAFTTKYRCRTPRERLYITGNHEILGSWDPWLGVPLTCIDGETWVGETNLPQRDEYEFKCVCIDSDHATCRWQDGSNRLLSLASVDDAAEPPPVGASCLSVDVPWAGEVVATRNTVQRIIDEDGMEDAAIVGLSRAVAAGSPEAAQRMIQSTLAEIDGEDEVVLQVSSKMVDTSVEKLGEVIEEAEEQIADDPISLESLEEDLKVAEHARRMARAMERLSNDQASLTGDNGHIHPPLIESTDM